jgi:hypothetical protein
MDYTHGSFLYLESHRISGAPPPIWISSARELTRAQKVGALASIPTLHETRSTSHLVAGEFEEAAEGARVLAAGPLDDVGELAPDFCGDGSEFGVVDEGEHPVGVDGGDVRLAVGPVDHDVAWK